MEIIPKGILPTDLWRNLTTIILKIKWSNLRKSSSSVNRKKFYNLYSRWCIMNLRVAKFFNFHFYIFVSRSFIFSWIWQNKNGNGFFLVVFFSDKNIFFLVCCCLVQLIQIPFLKWCQMRLIFFITCHFSYLKPSEKRKKTKQKQTDKKPKQRKPVISKQTNIWHGLYLYNCFRDYSAVI